MKKFRGVSLFKDRYLLSEFVALMQLQFNFQNCAQRLIWDHLYSDNRADKNAEVKGSQWLNEYAMEHIN